MRFPFTRLAPKALAVLAVLATASGTAATSRAAYAEAVVELDPIRRPETAERSLPPLRPVVPPASTATPEASGWPAKIEARLKSLSDRTVPGAGTSAVDPELAERLADIAATAGPRARVGISVRDLASGSTLFDLDADALLNPASNLKLLTATAAVELLGPDFRFETSFARVGDDLVIVGGGDPSLQLEDFEAIADALPAHAIAGAKRIVVDDHVFSDRRFGPGYDDGGPGHSYEAPSGALSLQFNTVEVTVSPSAPGEPPRVSVKPSCEHVQVSNTAQTARGGGLRVTTDEAGDHTRVSVRGRIASGRQRIRRRITDPGLFAATAFARILAERRDLPELAVTRGEVPSGTDPVFVHRSASLPDVLGSALKFSNNFTTEQVLRVLGHLHSGQPGDWHNGREVVRRFWSALGLSEDELVFENASGLGRRGRITPRALVALLSLAADPDRGTSAMLAAMPVAGREGTLAGRLRRTHGRVRAKTGTLSGASGLTGVISDSSGAPRVAFSILVNGRIGTRRARRLQDRVVRALVADVG